MLEGLTYELFSLIARQDSRSSSESVSSNTPVRRLRSSRNVPSVERFSKRSCSSNHSLKPVDSLHTKSHADGKETRENSDQAFSVLSQKLNDNLTLLHHIKNEQETTRKPPLGLRDTLRRIKATTNERNGRYTVEEAKIHEGNMNKIKERVAKLNVKKSVTNLHEHFDAGMTKPTSGT